MSAKIRDSVRLQYERFPYPPVPRLALPRRGEGEALRFELGGAGSHAGRRILVAGAGAFETQVVLQMHPQAAEVLAVDLSASSVARTRFRAVLARITRPACRLPPLRAIHADLLEWAPTGGGFDYVLASNLLQHVEDPAALFRRLCAWLKPGGVLRVVTYPRASRIFMRETSRWLTLHGVRPETPRLAARARELIATLPAEHPVRSCFESQPETSSATGIVDAFLHACENPLSPLQWEAVARDSGMECVRESHDPASRSDFLRELLPRTGVLSRWERLQILDDLLELCANPVLWFRKMGEPRGVDVNTEAKDRWRRTAPLTFSASLSASLSLQAELGCGLLRARTLLAQAGVTLEQALQALRTEVGPRVRPPPQEDRVLPGLSILDYDPASLIQAAESALSLARQDEWHPIGLGNQASQAPEPQPPAPEAPQAAAAGLDAEEAPESELGLEARRL